MQLFTYDNLESRGSQNATVETPEIQESSIEMREKSQEKKATSKDRQKKRRSKSVGAPDFPYHLLPAYSNSLGKTDYNEMTTFYSFRFFQYASVVFLGHFIKLSSHCFIGLLY